MWVDTESRRTEQDSKDETHFPHTMEVFVFPFCSHVEVTGLLPAGPSSQTLLYGINKAPRRDGDAVRSTFIASASKIMVSICTKSVTQCPRALCDSYNKWPVLPYTALRKARCSLWGYELNLHPSCRVGLPETSGQFGLRAGNMKFSIHVIMCVILPVYVSVQRVP
jgi:hypothetical protein